METARAMAGPRPSTIRLPVLALLFLFSGFAALVYQVVWQRSLFAIYGVNIESVTIIVTAFLLGLGLGSLLGGHISRDPGRPAVLLFGLLELSIGAFGLVSLRLFAAVGAFTAGGSPLLTFTVSFLMLLLPTGLMGATLPILVAHSVRQIHNVGRSVAILYFVNTLGSAIASFATAVFLLGRLGQQGSVGVAASFNALAGTSALVAHWLGGRRG
jgi:predicted membrane-bound spermidine synthase